MLIRTISLLAAASLQNGTAIMCTNIFQLVRLQAYYTL
jgi:hypothetical protein